MISTTGDQFAYYELDNELRPVEYEIPQTLLSPIARITENCEPALCSVLFVAGAGGSLRAGVTENPVLLTRSVKKLLTNITCGGAPVYIWPGGGITLMVDVTKMPKNAFGYVPTPALVAPIEFTMRQSDYRLLGGHMDYILPIDDTLSGVLGRQNDHLLSGQNRVGQNIETPWPTDSKLYNWFEDDANEE